MSVKSHNKKRNVGLIYEFLVRTISMSLVEGNQSRSSTALNILKKHFRQGTELYKEFRLINSLMKVEVSSQTVAASIINEAKNAARTHDEKVLDREKSLLIRDINHKLDENGAFWDQPVGEYKMYATVQTLVNEWRHPTTASLILLAEYEDKLTRWLSEARKKPEVLEQLSGSVGENRLIFKMMTNKLNEKYGCILSNDQKSVLREYLFRTSTGKPTDVLAVRLNEIKENVLLSIDKYLSVDGENKYMRNKLIEARVSIEAETLQEVNDDLVTRFMLYMKLASELEAKE